MQVVEICQKQYMTLQMLIEMRSVKIIWLMAQLIKTIQLLKKQNLLELKQVQQLTKQQEKLKLLMNQTQIQMLLLIQKKQN